MKKILFLSAITALFTLSACEGSDVSGDGDGDESGSSCWSIQLSDGQYSWDDYFYGTKAEASEFASDMSNFHSQAEVASVGPAVESSNCED